MNSARVTMIVVAFAALLSGASASAQEIVSVYTKFDADKTCKHSKGTEVEDYGSWRCPGYGGLIVRLSAGDQRMTVSFGTSAKRAQGEIAAGETFPGFNSVYEGVVEWRIEKRPDGRLIPFATILRWNTRTEADAKRDDGRSTGRTLVVTRLNPGGICHVGYVDARIPGANEAARNSPTRKRAISNAGKTIRRNEAASALPGEGDLIEHLAAEALRGARNRAAAERAIEFDRGLIVGQRPHHHALQSALRHVLARG